ncbi:MAG: hypothetical protein AAF495_20070 [Pseudomonadota bacterium]
MTISIGAFKRIILLFWAIWWLLAFLTDAIGALKEIGAVAAPWLPHTNYPSLVESLAPYQVPGWLPPLLFAGIIAWSFASTLLFAQAAATPREPAERWRRRVNNAFIVSLSLWLAFFIADQIVMKFALEQNHMVQGGFQLLTFLAIHLVPDEPPRS